MSKTGRIVISGGGTGGHIFPAIAIARALQKRNPAYQILFVGAKGKMEMEKVPQAGYEIKGLHIAGFQRRMTWRNLLFPFKLLWSLIQAWWILRKFRPAVAVGVGGYASGPLLKVANWMKVPTVLQEQNSYPGVTNRLLAGGASVICVAFDRMEAYFPKEKLVWTGNPVRDAITDNRHSREEAVASFGLDTQRPVAFITGGSLGARALNQAVAANIEKLMSSGIQMIWQTGKLYIEQYRAFEERFKKHLIVTDFITDMSAAYAAADLIVSRAGGVIAELCIIGKAAILLPSPNVAEDHQTKNVMALVEKEAAVLLHDHEAEHKLGETMIALLKDEERRKKLGTNIHKLAKPDAADRIAREVEKLIA